MSCRIWQDIGHLAVRMAKSTVFVDLQVTETDKAYSRPGGHSVPPSRAANIHVEAVISKGTFAKYLWHRLASRGVCHSTCAKPCLAELGCCGLLQSALLLVLRCS